MMRHDDQLQMHVSTVCFLSLFCPKDESPKTLDVLAGVRPDGTPLKMVDQNWSGGYRNILCLKIGM